MPKYSVSKLSKKTVGETSSEHSFNELGELAEFITKNHWTPSLFHEVDYVNKDLIPRHGRHRANYNLREMHVIGLDVDGGRGLSEAIEDVRAYEYIIATSRSHQKDKGGVVADRFRILLFLEEPITNDADFKATWFALQKEFPYIDPACKDSARFYYQSPEIISLNPGGKLVKVVRAEKLNDSAQIATSAPSAEARVKGKLAASTMEFLINGADLGTRHNVMIKALIDLKENHYSESEALEKCMRAYEAMGAEWGEKQEARVCDVFKNPKNKYAARWPRTRKTKSGDFIPDKNAKENYFYLIQTLMGFTPRFNEMTCRAELTPENTEYDVHLARICNTARENNLYSQAGWIEGYIIEAANSNRYHPLKQILDEREAAGPYAGLLNQLINTIEFQVPSGLEELNPIPTYQDYVRKWFIGMMAKVLQPGAQNLVLVFLGSQGIGKSRWLARLAVVPHIYGEGAIDPSNKDHVMYHLGRLIHHVPELDSVTSKREAGALKDFFTKDYIAERAAYAHGETRGRSVCSFCASVNDETFLTDMTGNRRYLVIPIKSIDHNHTVDVLGALVEARALARAGERYWLSAEDQARNEELLEPYLMVTSLEDQLGALQPGDDFMTAHDIFSHLCLQPSYGDFARLARAMKKMGFAKVRRKDPDARYARWGYLVHKF